MRSAVVVGRSRLGQIDAACRVAGQAFRGRRLGPSQQRPARRRRGRTARGYLVRPTAPDAVHARSSCRPRALTPPATHAANRARRRSRRTRFSEKFTGIDPGFQPLTLMSDLPFSSTRPEDDYVDLTDVGLVAHAPLCFCTQRGSPPPAVLVCPGGASPVRPCLTSCRRTPSRFRVSSGPCHWNRTTASRLPDGGWGEVGASGSTVAPCSCPACTMPRSTRCAQPPRRKPCPTRRYGSVRLACKEWRSC